jgi:hypothetical protein
VPPSATAATSTDALQVPCLGRHVGETIRLGLFTGKVLVEELVVVNQFCLGLRPQPGADTVLLWKHSTIDVAPAPAEGQQP